MASFLDTVASNIEVVERAVQNIFDNSAFLAGQIKPAKVTTISRYFWRKVLKSQAGGHAAKIAANEGVLPSGTGMKLFSLQGGYFYNAIGFRVTQEQMDVKEQSIVDVLSDTLASGMTEALVDQDILLHTDGTGVLTEASSSITGTNTMYFAGATDYLGVNRLRPGMCVDVWDTALSTKRSAGTADPIIINTIDYDAKKVVFDQNVTALAATDKLTYRALTVHGPATPVTAQSTFPVSEAGGVGGDSFRHGIPYMTDPTSTTYRYGKLLSSYPQLIPSRVNAGGNALEWDFGHRLIAKMDNRRGGDPWKNMKGIANWAQRAALFQLGTAIVNKQITGTQFGPSLDLSPSNKGEGEIFEFCGLPVMVSKRQDRSRIDFVDMSQIGRAELFPARFHKDPSGKMFFEGRNSSGNVLLYTEFWVVQAYDWFHFDTGLNGRIDSLALPASWDA